MAQSNNENGRWITTDRGSHVFIKEGQSVEEALSERFDEEALSDIVPGSARDLNISRSWARGIIERAHKRGEKTNIDELVEKFKGKGDLTEEELDKLKESLQKYQDKLDEFDSFEEDTGIPEQEHKERGFYNYYEIDEDNDRFQYGVSKEKYDRLPDKLKGRVVYTKLEDRLDGMTIEEADALVNEAIANIENYNSVNKIERYINSQTHFTKGIPIFKSYEKEINEAWGKAIESKNKKALDSLSKSKMSHKPKYSDAIEFGNPLYHTSSRYRNNCYKCAQWFDLYMRGYALPVQASSCDDNGKRIKEQYDEENKLGWHLMMYNEPVGGLKYYGYDYTLGGAKSWKKDNLGSLGGSGPSQLKKIKDIVKKAGPGSRFMICTAWQSGSAHAFNAYCDKDGEPHVIDIQHQRANADIYFDVGSVKASKTMLIRIDDLTLNENYKKVVYDE